MAERRILKLGNIKRQNTLAVLDVLRRSNGISRVELAQALHCDNTTITRVSSELASLGLIVSGGMNDSTGGRPRELLNLNVDWGMSMGIVLDPNYIIGTLIDLSGQVKVREQTFFRRERSLREFCNALEHIGDQLVKAAGKRLLGVGVAATGTFSEDGSSLEEVAEFRGLQNFNILGFFKERYGLIPEITDIVVARVQNEIWFKRVAPQGSLLLVHAGAGIGSALALDGKLVFSRKRHGGELGHNIYQPNGELCVCGRHGCLETFCSTGSIERKLRHLNQGSPPSFENISALYNDGDERVQAVIENAVLYLGIAISNQINNLAPDAVIISGELLKLGDKFYERLQKVITENVFPFFSRRLKLLRGDSSEAGIAIGAASLVFGRFFSDFEYFNSAIEHLPRGKK